MKNFTLTVTEPELQVIANALAQRPYAEVAQLLVALQSQVNMQGLAAENKGNGIDVGDRAIPN